MKFQGGNYMHIPDNYLSPSTCLLMVGAMVPVWKKASARTKEELSKKKIPMIGICASFSFLVMMFNIPLPGGTSGHAIGAVLVAILLGPYAATVAVTIAIAIQALFFGDGGILAFGANCFNMAFIMPFSGYLIYKTITLRFKGAKGDYVAAFAAGYIGVNLAALMAGFEFGIQPLLFSDASGMPLYCPYSLNVTVPAMVIPHILVVGLIEGGVTAAVLGYVRKVSPEAVHQREALSYKPYYVLLVVLAALAPLGLLATGTAFGEWSSREISSVAGFIPAGMEKGFSFSALFTDYSITGMSGVEGYIISAVLGMLIISSLTNFIYGSKKSKQKQVKTWK
jgi:cobalt/nickel transport system permease protein